MSYAAPPEKTPKQRFSTTYFYVDLTVPAPPGDPYRVEQQKRFMNDFTDEQINNFLSDGFIRAFCLMEAMSQINNSRLSPGIKPDVRIDLAKSCSKEQGEILSNHTIRKIYQLDFNTSDDETKFAAWKARIAKAKTVSYPQYLALIAPSADRGILLNQPNRFEEPAYQEVLQRLLSTAPPTPAPPTPAAPPPVASPPPVQPMTPAAPPPSRKKAEKRDREEAPAHLTLPVAPPPLPVAPPPPEAAPAPAGPGPFSDRALRSRQREDKKRGREDDKSSQGPAKNPAPGE